MAHSLEPARDRYDAFEGAEIASTNSTYAKLTPLGRNKRTTIVMKHFEGPEIATTNSTYAKLMPLRCKTDTIQKADTIQQAFGITFVFF